jgi:outer membrane protein OmpA-like peptidoglycan-associated protein
MKKNRFCFIIIAIALLSCQAGLAAERPTVNDWLQRGMEFERQFAYGEAIKMYTGAVSLDRNSAEAYFRRGRAYIAYNKSYAMEALADFDKAIDLDPTNAEAYYQRGLLNAIVINNEDAYADMKTAARLGHEGAQTWLSPERGKKGKESERLDTKVAVVPATEMVSPPPAAGTEEKTVKEKGGAFFGPGNRLPSGSEPMIYFDFNKENIKEQYDAILDEVAMVLMEKLPEAIVTLAGHTDSTGTEKYNDALSLRRAKAVESYLADKRGIPANRMIVKGYGENAPIATNEMAEGRAKNRRVEILDAEK